MPYLGRDHRPGWRGPWPDGFAPDPPGFRMSRAARLWVPVVVSFLVQVPASFFGWADDRGPMVGGGRPTLLELGIALIGPIALIGARRFPGPVVAIVAAAASADLLVGNPDFAPPYIALAFAIIGAIARGARIWAWASVGTAWVVTLALAIWLSVDLPPGRVAGTTFGLLIVFGIGEGMRSRKEHFEQYRRGAAERKQTEVQAERVRIARELHDVLAHSLSQINVQASVGLHLMDKQPAKAAEALASIKDSSKTALEEVRSVLGVLRAEDGQDPDAPLVPEPDLSRLAGLAASVTSQGVTVSLENSVSDAPKAVQLAIYRIAQESLTNVVRHSGATEASVNVGIEGSDYLLSVSDNGKGAPAGGDHTGGRGLLGMRERAELLGGRLETASSVGGGFTVTARIPRQEAPE